MSMKKDRTVFVPVKLPSINSRPSTETSKSSITRPSSQPRTTASNLQKILFEKLNDYDGLLRKQKRQEKLEKKVKPQPSGKSQHLSLKAENKKPVGRIEDIKERAKQIREEKSTYSLKQIKSEEREEPGKTFITGDGVASMHKLPNPNDIDTDEFMKSFENYRYECSQDELQGYLQSCNIQDYDIGYTEDKELQSMRKCLKQNETELEELENSMNQMIRMIGHSIIPKELESGVIEEKEEGV